MEEGYFNTNSGREFVIGKKRTEILATIKPIKDGYMVNYYFDRIEDGVVFYNEVKKGDDDFEEYREKFEKANAEIRKCEFVDTLVDEIIEDSIR